MVITSICMTRSRRVAHVGCSIGHDKFQRWFYEMPHVYGDDILRSKGIFDFKNQDERYVIQVVHTFVRGSAMGPGQKISRANRV